MDDSDTSGSTVVETLDPQPHGGALKRSNKKLVPIDETPSLAAQSLDITAKEQLSEKDFVTLKMVASAIGKDGLKLEEACILSNVDFDSFRLLAEKYPVIQRVIHIKEIEYKHMLMRALSKRARSGDDKISQWLLESRYPEEFGTKRQRKNGDDNSDLLASAISFIQESGDKDTLVRREARLTTVRKVAADPDVRKLQSFLS